MGVGKSSIARDLAKYLVWNFVDLDSEVEALSKQGINELTDREGLEAVRRTEELALGKIEDQTKQVVALGAGTLLKSENLALVRSSGLLIFLSAELKTLAERLVGDTSKKRPLFGDYVTAVQDKSPNAEKALMRQISSLLSERLPTYVKADLKIDTDGKSIRAITIETEKRLRQREQRAEPFEAP